LLIDVGEAWRVAWPKALLSAPNGVFDAAFEVMAHFSPSTRWAFNHASWTMGIHHPSDFFDAWKPYTLQGLTNRIQCPLLGLFGEDEIARSIQ
jgi:hypothetical protein